MCQTCRVLFIFILPESSPLSPLVCAFSILLRSNQSVTPHCSSLLIVPFIFKQDTIPMSRSPYLHLFCYSLLLLRPHLGALLQSFPPFCRPLRSALHTDNLQASLRIALFSLHPDRLFFPPIFSFFRYLLFESSRLSLMNANFSSFLSYLLSALSPEQRPPFVRKLLARRPPGSSARFLL